MAKRFTDTEKWNKRFVRGLQAPYKLLWVYILDECSAAGIWDVDIDVAQIKLGVKLNQEIAERNFGEKIKILDGGSKWFIPAFIEFQYGTLSENNRAHTKIIQTLKKLLLLDENLELIQAPYKPLTSPLQGAKVEDKVKEQVEVKVKEQVEGVQGEILIFPFDTENFKAMWLRWKAYKLEQHKFKYKSISTEQASLNELTKLSKGYELTAIEIILQSIAQGWKGFFELKQNSNNGSANSDNRKYGNIPGGSTSSAFAKIDSMPE